MSFLFLSIVCSVSVSILLKLARRHGISIEVAVAINYIVAVLATWFFLKPSPPDDLQLPSILITIGLGILLPTIFVVMGQSIRHAGIVRSDAAQRISLIIPIVLSFTLFGEAINLHTLVGLVIAFIALGCLLHRPSISENGEEHTKRERFKVMTLLLLVWFGYGTIDVLFKQMAKLGNAFPTTLFISFIAAGAVMWVYLISSLIRKFFQKRKDSSIEDISMPSITFNKMSIFGGVVLGILNFANIYTYIQAHIHMSENPSIVFAGMNMGVISLGTIVGAFIFKETVSRINLAGVFIALVAIYLLLLW